MKRLVLLLAGLIGLGAGLAIGARLRWAVEPPTLAASPAEGAVLAAVEVGSRLRLTLVRDGRRREVEVPVEEAQPNG